MKIVILDGHAVNPGDLSWDFLKEFGEVTVYERTPEDQTARRIGDAEIVLLNKVPIDASIMDQCPNIRLICVLATGYNVVDVTEARSRGITVCNVPGYSTQAVAQFAFGLLLEHCHHIGHHSDAVHAGRWSSCPDFCFWDTPLVELAGKTMGIIGFGSIGQAVARLARAFGMEVLAYSRTPKETDLAAFVPLETLLANSDVVTLHCPLTPQTRHLMNAETLGKMKDGAVLINTARGDVVVEADIAQALRSGKLSAYAADVVSQEPIPVSSPLLGAPNCILTPHMAWAPKEARIRIQRITRESILAFLHGTPVHTV